MLSKSALTAAAALATLSMQSTGALALPITTTNDINTLTNSLLAPNSGINITSRSLIGAANQQGTFTPFNLAPASGSSPTITLNQGVVLTSGTANLPTSNTTNEFDPVVPATGPYAPLTVLASAPTFDSNVLQYTFTVAASVTSITAKFFFGTDEFPTQSVTDIFGFFVDGVNYAQFPNGDLISNTPGNPTNFIDNPVGGSLYPIEYNGLTSVFTVTGLLNSALSVHTLAIGIADTSDSIFDSGVFLSGLMASTSTSGGIGDPTAVPEPASIALFGMGLLGMGMIRRRKANKA